MSATLFVKLSHNANGGSGGPGTVTGSSSRSTPGSVSVTVNASSSKPTRTGYNFTGWSPSSVTKSYVFTQSQIDNSAKVTINASTTAQWSIKTYTVKYYANGDGIAPATQKKTYGKTLTLTNDVAEWPGYRFLKWNTSPDGDGEDYLPGAEYTSNEALDLYAQWEQVASTISLSANRMNVVNTISIDRNVSGNVSDTISYSFNGGEEVTIVEKTTAASVSYTFPSSLATSIPNDQYGELIVYCETFVDGVSAGKVPKSFNLYVPVYEPSVSFSSFADTNTDVVSTIGQYVQGQSTIGGSVNAVGAFGSSIASVSVTINGETFDSEDFETDILNFSGNQIASAVAVDSRGITGIYEKHFSVLPYNPPVLRASIGRDEEDVAVMTLDSYSISALDNLNAKNYIIEYRVAGDEDWITADIGTFALYAGTNLQYSLDDLQFDTSYDVRFVVEDTFNQVDYQVSLPASNSIIMRVDSATKEVYFPYEIHVGADKRTVPTGGGTSFDLLWENPNTKATFAAQTLSLDLTEYDFIGVEVISAYNSDAQFHSTLQWIPKDGVAHYAVILHASGNYNFMRAFTMRDDGVVITEGYRNGSHGTGYCIPAKIYGIKGVALNANL